ncbi:helix-turn-helix domain-containing protein [Streptomyces sp. NPDC048560]|uniref:helix-turn-helix transcriptional regulator n=1 Tax=Streptomyces sp. NPDC048560 TaxID=3155488 RepID=UPI003431566A
MALKVQLYSPAALAEYLGVPLKTVYRWNHTGTGPKPCPVGRHVRYRPTDVEAWLDRQQGGSAAA